LEISNLARQEQIPEWRAEAKLLGCTHAELGAYLLGLWGLPDPVVEAVAFHHRPRECVSKRFSPLTAVHAADFFADSQEKKSAGDVKLAELDSTYLEEAGVLGRYPCWQTICQVTMEEGLSDELKSIVR